MVITVPNLVGMFTGFDVSFQSGYQAAPVLWDKVATLRPSKTRQNTYGWMQKIPILRKWVGDRQLNSLASYFYTLINDKYEDTVEIDKNEIEDDQYGLYAPNVQQLGWASKKWPDYLITAVMQTGESTACYDGNNFFDPAHPINKYTPSLGTYANYFTATPLTYDNYQSVRAKQMAIQGEDGKPLGIIPDVLAVPPQLEGIGRSILQADTIAPQTFVGQTNVGGQTNVYKGTAELVVYPELASQPLAWYLLSTKGPLKPFMFQQRQAPEFTFMNRPDDYNVFMTDKFVMGVKARGAGGFTLPFLAMKATG